jgi:hypothetical protein
MFETVATTARGHRILGSDSWAEYKLSQPTTEPGVVDEQSYKLMAGDDRKPVS